LIFKARFLIAHISTILLRLMEMAIHPWIAAALLIFKVGAGPRACPLRQENDMPYELKKHNRRP